MNNRKAIQKQIEYKNNYNVPYYSNGMYASQVITDMDHFPYTRYFRGIYNQSAPQVMDREAGWCPQRNDCYKFYGPNQPTPANYCWEYPCSTVFPCPDSKKEVEMDWGPNGKPKRMGKIIFSP